MSKYRKKSNTCKIIVAFLIAAVLAAGVCCMGYAARGEDGKWFGNPNLSTWHWDDPSAEENGEETKEPAAFEEGGEEVHPNENSSDKKTSEGYNAVLERKAMRAASIASDREVIPVVIVEETAEHTVTITEDSVLSCYAWMQKYPSSGYDDYEYVLTMEYTGAAAVASTGEFSFIRTTSLGDYTVKITISAESNATAHTYKIDFSSSSIQASSLTYKVKANSLVSQLQIKMKTSNLEFVYTNGDPMSGFPSFDKPETKFSSSSSTYSFIRNVTQRSNTSVTSTDGSLILRESLKLYENTYSLPDDPVKEGHTFIGWYYDEEYTRPYDGEPIKADTQLYAKFEINQYTVTFDSQNGSPNTETTVNWNTSATLPTVTREGYKLTGWYLFDGTQYIDQPIKEDTLLVARWEIKTFTITYVTNGGEPLESEKIEYNGIFEPKTPVREGYTFVGWYYDESLTMGYDYSASAAITKSQTIYAKWEINHYTVTFDTAGGNEMAAITIDHGETLTLETPERTGYNFLGWYLDGEEYVPVPVTSELTLTASWQIKTFTVTFYVDGEVYTTAEVEYGTKLVSVMLETANLMNLCVTSMGVPVEGNFAEIEITENLDVTAVEMTDTEKVFNVIKNYMWWIVGGVGGAIVVIGIIVAIACAKKPKEITAGAKSPTKRGRK